MATEPQTTDEQQHEISQRHQEAVADVLPDETAQLYIGGEWVESASGETFNPRDPTTGEALTSVQAGTEEDIDRAVAAAWEAFDERWADTTPTDRQELLTEIADRIEARKEDFATIETLDNGKPITEARVDIDLVVDHFRYFAGATRINEGETVPSDDSRHIETINEPYGVVGQIVPWNFPLVLAAWKLAPALAAGNTVVLKPAEETPLSILELMREIDDVLPDGVVNIVTGFGSEAGAPLAAHEDIRKIAFTGSTEIGREIMRSAADTITDITLELGGKSPVVIYPDADIETAVDVTMLAMFYNTGECCAAGTRLFVHDDIKEDFMDGFVAAAERLTMGDPLNEDTDLGPKVSDEQVQRTMEYIEAADETGGTIVTGGGQPDDEALEEGAFVTPTVIDDIDHDAEAVQEEIFGPVEEVFAWSDYDEMIEQANDVEYGLAAGVITNDISQAYETARDLQAGNIWINQYNDFPVGQPFGGYKQSGIGRETAFETMDHYTQTKAINLGL
jgi:aldehyde dehydrogenase (NAD+)